MKTQSSSGKTNFNKNAFETLLRNRHTDVVMKHLRDQMKRNSISRFLNDPRFQAFLADFDTESDTDEFQEMISAFKDNRLPV
jgi:hypothetical protein